MAETKTLLQFQTNLMAFALIVEDFLFHTPLSLLSGTEQTGISNLTVNLETVYSAAFFLCVR